MLRECGGVCRSSWQDAEERLHHPGPRRRARRGLVCRCQVPHRVLQRVLGLQAVLQIQTILHRIRIRFYKISDPDPTLKFIPFKLYTGVLLEDHIRYDFLMIYVDV